MSRPYENLSGRNPARSEYGWIERQVTRAYMQLRMIEPDDEGFRIVDLGRFGDVEAQLTELPPDRVHSRIPPIWLEIFSCTSRATVDGYGYFELGEDELANAVDIILRAMQRNRQGV